MGLNFKLIRRTNKTSTSDVMHSSGYASIGNGAGFGASDNTTFSERQQIEQNRKMIKGYRNARVAQGVNRMPGARTYEQEQAPRKTMATISEQDLMGEKREFNNRLERGGIQNNRLSQIQQRTARSERFSAPARPTPKTGGFGR